MTTTTAPELPAAAADVLAAVVSELLIARDHEQATTVGDFAADVAAALMRRYDVGQELTDDEPTDAGPLVCAECGSGAARTYVVTFLGGDQDDDTARTEVCEPCNEELVHGPAEDETVDRHTGRTLARGRCDTCGAPCTADTGECTRDRGHAAAVDLDEPRRCAVGRCTYLAHDARDLEEHAALNHPRG